MIRRNDHPNGNPLPGAGAVHHINSDQSAVQQNSELFDHIVGATEQQRWHVEVQRLGGLEIDDQFKLCRRLDREVGRLLALEDAVDVLWHLAKLFDKISTIGDQAA